MENRQSTEEGGGVVTILQRLIGGSDKFYRNRTKTLQTAPSSQPRNNDI